MKKILLSIAMLALSTISAQAGNGYIIQVSTDNEKTHTIALNNAINIQKHYGAKGVDVSVVAYGPGLGLLTKDSRNSSRIEKMAMHGIKFIACGNTMKKWNKKKQNPPLLSQGVSIVPGGVIHIGKLQKRGYVYLRP